MGNLSMSNYKQGPDKVVQTYGAEDKQISMYRCFQLLVEDSCFKHESGLSKFNICDKIIENFNIKMLIYVKRNGYSDSPDVAKLKIVGSISEITVMLTPYTYCHLINISRLFYPGTTQQLDSKGKPLEGNPMCFAKLKKKA